MKGIQLFDEIHAYFIENVLSSYQDYKKRRFETKSGQSTDLRKALIASSFLYHFREHLPKQFIKSRKEFSVMCLDYDVLGDVVNVSKHNTLTQNWKYVNSVKNIFEIVVSTEFIDEKGKYFFHEKKILIKLIDDTERDINEILTNVLNMWYNYLYKVGILKKKYFEKFIKPEFPLSREKCGEGKLDLENIQGVRFQHSFRLQRYNYLTGGIEPINLEGSKLKMRIYKPKYDVDLKLTNDKNGKEISITIKISDEENLEIHQIKSEEKLKNYLTNLAVKQGVIKINSGMQELLDNLKIERINE